MLPAQQIIDVLADQALAQQQEAGDTRYTLEYILSNTQEVAVGKPLTIQDEDDRRIEDLKKRLGVCTKIAVVRAGLDLLEEAAERRARVVRWRKAARVAAPTSREVNAEFRAHTRLKKL